MGPEVLAIAAFASTAMGVVGQLTAAQPSSAVPYANAQIAEQDAAAARSSGAADAEDIRRKGRLAQGTARANAGASGLLADGGSPYEVLLENAQEIELDAQRRLFKGETDARRYEDQARLERIRGGEIASQRPNYLAAGAGLLEGGVKAYKILGDKSPSTTKPPSGTG